MQFLVVFVAFVGCICWLVVGCAPLVRPDRRPGGTECAGSSAAEAGGGVPSKRGWCHCNRRGEAAKTSQEVSLKKVFCYNFLLELTEDC